jgi:hypothetical protein
VVRSPITGGDGNVEFLADLRPKAMADAGAEVAERIELAVRA